MHLTECEFDAQRGKDAYALYGKIIQILNIFIGAIDESLEGLKIL